MTLQHKAGIPQPLPAVILWAGLGLILLAVEVYFLILWLGGDGFRAVPYGPSEPPGWMKVTLVVGQFGCTLAMLFCFFRFLYQPWRRTGTIPVAGLVGVAGFITSPYDVTSNYFQHWFTYNSYLINRGSLLTVLPGVISYNAPGVTSAWPIFIAPPVYVFMFTGLMLLGDWVMRRARQRFPAIGNVGLVVCCFTVMAVAEIVVEGFLFIRLGFWTVAGGHPMMNGGRYYSYPLTQVVFAAAFFTGLASLYHFTNDRGQTLVERGIDRIGGAAGWKGGMLRLLAFLASFQVCMGLLYHLPSAIAGIYSRPWPADLQQRSYFTDHICGPETGRVCGIPFVRSGAYCFVDPAGHLIVPSGSNSVPVYHFQDTHPE